MLSTGFGSMFTDMQRIADEIKWNVENQLQEAFKTFEVTENLTPSTQDEKNAYYRFKIKTDDNGHVRVKTMQKEPGSDWKVQVEEYDRGNKPIESQKTSKQLLDKPDTFLQDVQRMSDRIKRDVESQLQQVFKTFDVMENRLKIKTDDNGQVKVKTLQDTPKSDVKVQIEGFKKGEESEETVEKTKESKESTLKKQQVQKGDSFFSDIQRLTDEIRENVEKQMQRAFKTFEAVENRLKIKTDDNGEVQVKASEQEAGKDWKVEVENFNRGEKPLEGSKEGGKKEAMVQ